MNIFTIYYLYYLYYCIVYHLYIENHFNCKIKERKLDLLNNYYDIWLLIYYNKRSIPIKCVTDTV